MQITLRLRFGPKLLVLQLRAIGIQNNVKKYSKKLILTRFTLVTTANPTLALIVKIS